MCSTPVAEAIGICDPRLPATFLNFLPALQLREQICGKEIRRHRGVRTPLWQMFTLMAWAQQSRPDACQDGVSAVSRKSLIPGAGSHVLVRQVETFRSSTSAIRLDARPSPSGLETDVMRARASASDNGSTSAATIACRTTPTSGAFRRARR